MIALVRGALSRERVVRVRLSETIEAIIYDRPGVWMSDTELAELRAQLRTVADAAIPGPLDYGVFSAQRAPFENRLVVIGRHLGSGDITGFNAMPTLSVKLGPRTVNVLHLGLVAIHPAYQRQGMQGLLYGLGGFSALHRIPDDPVWISNVTEVPAIFGAVSDHFVDVYPSYRHAREAPPEHLDLARAIVAHHRHEFGVGAEATFDEQRFVIQGSYTGGSDALKKTADQAPRYRDPACNEYCRAQLDYGRGDDFIQLGKMDRSVITNFLERRIPAPFRPQAARQMKLWQYPARKT